MYFYIKSDKKREKNTFSVLSRSFYRLVRLFLITHAHDIKVSSAQNKLKKGNIVQKKNSLFWKKASKTSTKINFVFN